MQLSVRVVTLAHKEAINSFGYLVDEMVEQADIGLGQSLRTASLGEQRVLGLAREFMRDQGKPFRNRLRTAYEELLNRAMQTMHNDLRSGLGDFSADTLTLIEDDVVTRAIEVERLVVRLRDADQISLGQLNLIIAQLHGVSEVSERENPFRPYLLARALHDTVRRMVDQPATANVLFQHLAAGMAAQQAGFYSRVLSVFESHGVRSRLLARPSALNRYERDRLALKQAADELRGKVEAKLDDPASAMRAHMLPRMQRMLELVQREDQRAGPQQAKDLQDLVWEVFHQPRSSHPPRRIAVTPDRSRLEQRLVEMQRAAASASATDAPLTLRDRVADLATPQERLTIDLVALLFDFIQHDEQMCGPMRQQLVRLHLPFLRAALQQPTLLHDAGHPARRLLDRAGSLAVTVGCGTPMDGAMLAEMERLVGDILRRFDADAVLFSDAEGALDAFFARQLALHDPVVARAAAALDRAEVAAPVLEKMRAALRELLEPVKADRRMIEFIVTTWAQVMVHCHATHPAYRAMLAELLWSAQEKPGPEDRAILMRLLPDLGKRLRAGLSQIAMPDGLAKEALDRLMVVHMDVLANKRLRSHAVRLSQRALNDVLQGFNAEKLFAEARQAGTLSGGPGDMAASLAAAGIAATLADEPARFVERLEDADVLKLARQGTAFERLVDGHFRPLILEAVGGAQLGFLFRDQLQPARVAFTRQSLLTAMRDGSLRPIEHAPLFERAVESLMTGAESLAA